MEGGRRGRVEEWKWGGVGRRNGRAVLRPCYAGRRALGRSLGCAFAGLLVRGESNGARIGRRAACRASGVRCGAALMSAYDESLWMTCLWRELDAY